MELNKEQIQMLSDKIFVIANILLPGVLILDVFFGIGLFSNTVFSLYQFILYLIWSIAISLLFKIFSPSKLDFASEVFIYELDLEIISHDEEKEAKEIINNTNEGLLLLHTLVRVLIMYLIMIVKNKININYIDNKIIWIFIYYAIATIIAYPIGVLMSNIYVIIAKYVYKKYEKVIIHK